MCSKQVVCRIFDVCLCGKNKGLLRCQAMLTVRILAVCGVCGQLVSHLVPLNYAADPE